MKFSQFFEIFYFLFKNLSHSHDKNFLLVECLVALGYKREDIEASLAQTRYDDVHATYLLISRKNTDVSRFTEKLNSFCNVQMFMNSNLI
jgi:hypothetical protein